MYANKEGINWFPINLHINGTGKKELGYVNSNKGDGYMPKTTDFQSLETKDLVKRQALVSSFDYIALDTSKILQIDFDTSEHPEVLDKLTKKCPYFKSSTKNLPHCFITLPEGESPGQNRFITKYKNVEVLSGQWSYCHKDSIVHNYNCEIPTVPLQTLLHPIQTNSKIKETNVPNIINVDYNTLSEVVSSLNVKRCEQYEDWLSIVFAILKTGFDNDYRLQAETLVHAWSKGCPSKYDPDYLNNIINKHFDPDKSPSFPTLCYFLKHDSPEFFKQISAKCDSDIKHTDLSASETFEQFAKNNGYYYAKCNKELFWYSPDSGLWNQGLDGIRNIITLCFDLGPYRTSANKQSSMLLLFKERIPNDPNFYLRSYDSTKHKIAFNNGIYDFSSHKLIPFDKDFIFFYKLEWNYTEQIDLQLAQKIKQKIFYDVFDEQRGQYFMDLVSRAVAGEVKDKTFNVVIGDSNSGKGVNSTINENAFGRFCCTFNAENMKIHQSQGDQAKSRSWMIMLQFARIAIANECSMNSPLDGNKIKEFSGGGDTICARLNHKDEINFRIQATPFYFINDMPQIKPMMQELKNRLKYIETQYSYLSGTLYEQQKKMPNVRVADPDIKDVFCTDKNVLQTYAIMICQNYKPFSPDPPPEVLDSNIEWTVHDDAFSKINELFDATDDEDDVLSSRDVINSIKHLGLDISDNKIGREMTKLGFRKKVITKNKKSIKVYTNIKLSDD